MTIDNVFMLIALVSTGIFLVQFVISVFIGDLDVDVDGDTNVDFDMGSMFSFKGLVHFLIGFGWTKVLFTENSWQSYALAVVVGLAFMITLFYTYMLAFRLQSLRKPEPPEQLVGRPGKVYINNGNGRYTVFIQRDGSLRELDVVSISGNADYQTDQTVTVMRFENNTFYIE